jgi:hypothetical protein
VIIETVRTDETSGFSNEITLSYILEGSHLCLSSPLDIPFTPFGYSLWVLKSEGKMPLERSIRRSEDKFKTALQNLASDCVEWIHLSQVGEEWRALVNR